MKKYICIIFFIITIFIINGCQSEEDSPKEYIIFKSGDTILYNEPNTNNWENITSSILSNIYLNKNISDGQFALVKTKNEIYPINGTYNLSFYNIKNIKKIDLNYVKENSLLMEFNKKIFEVEPDSIFFPGIEYYDDYIIVLDDVNGKYLLYKDEKLLNKFDNIKELEGEI